MRRKDLCLKNNGEQKKKKKNYQTRTHCGVRTLHQMAMWQGGRSEANSHEKWPVRCTRPTISVFPKHTESERETHKQRNNLGRAHAIPAPTEDRDNDAKWNDVSVCGGGLEGAR